MILSTCCCCCYHSLLKSDVALLKKTFYYNITNGGGGVQRRIGVQVEFPKCGSLATAAKLDSSRNVTMEGQSVLKTTTANGCCIVLAFLYVVGFYLFRQSQDKKLTRDHPTVIRKRIQSVMAASLASWVVVWAVVPSQVR